MTPRTMHRTILSAAILGIALAATTSARAAGDPRKGADAFAEECGDCHSATAGKNKKGPSLAGVVGRHAAAVADFAGYSEAMKQSGISWTPERIDAYVAQPRKVVPAGRMKYDGLPDAAMRADLIAYLSTLR